MGFRMMKLGERVLVRRSGWYVPGTVVGWGRITRATRDHRLRVRVKLPKDGDPRGVIRLYDFDGIYKEPTEVPYEVRFEPARKERPARWAVRRPVSSAYWREGRKDVAYFDDEKKALAFCDVRNKRDVT